MERDKYTVWTFRCFPDTPCSFAKTPQINTYRPTSKSPTRLPTDSPTSKPVSTLPDGRCNTNADCSRWQFCVRLGVGAGYCGECLSDGTGCSTEEVCRTSGCRSQTSQVGAPKCYTQEELDRDCRIRWQLLYDGVEAVRCNLDNMTCESQNQANQQDIFDPPIPVQSKQPTRPPTKYVRSSQLFALARQLFTRMVCTNPPHLTPNSHLHLLAQKQIRCRQMGRVHRQLPCRA